ncbi:glycoside hydrolase family 5 protein [Desulfovibrio sp. UCD-KL4C]|uniref:glycoside hydrolase family 5 protein n=1 Tax=Desulfovibrio sp. UCD-KL4C TaxID=2578120 RepID=UPI0025B91220|nr:glycoside hydrolase family 5 protein [Desulfovibrio sp. UCD-KL4C]
MKIKRNSILFKTYINCKNLRFRYIALAILFMVLACPVLNLCNARVAFAYDGPLLKGFNLAGAEFGSKILPGKEGTNYFWPKAADVKMYASAGATILRIPFKWERMQPTLYLPLEKSELNHLDTIIREAKKENVLIILDPHNYGNYRGNIIGSMKTPTDAFLNFWKRLATYYKNTPQVVFGLMNEPHSHSAKDWAYIVQKCIWSIRGTGAKQLILVPGTRWSGAHSWLSGNKSNADALKNIFDPENNFMFEVHQYLDKRSSGTESLCVNENIGIKRLEGITKWLRKNKQKAFLGEFGIANNQLCLNSMDNMLKYIEKNSDAWGGWTYWAGSKYFGKYMFNIYPADSSVFPQFKILQKYMKNK